MRGIIGIKKTPTVLSLLGRHFPDFTDGLIPLQINLKALHNSRSESRVLEFTSRINEQWALLDRADPLERLNTFHLRAHKWSLHCTKLCGMYT